MMYTYFLQSVNGGAIKIGKSQRPPEDRRKGCQTGNPHALFVVGVLSGDKESELHNMWTNLKTNPHTGEKYKGEWFHNSEELVSFINAKARQKELLHDLIPAKSIGKPKVYTDEEQVVIEEKKVINKVQIQDGFLDCDYIVNVGEEYNENEDEIYRMTEDGWFTYMRPRDMGFCLYKETGDEKYLIIDDETGDVEESVSVDYDQLDRGEKDIVEDQKLSNPCFQEDYMIYVMFMIDNFNHHREAYGRICNPWVDKVGFNVESHTMFVFTLDSKLSSPRQKLLDDISHMICYMNDEDEDCYQFTKDSKYSVWNAIAVLPNGYGIALALRDSEEANSFSKIDHFSHDDNNFKFFKIKDYLDQLNNKYDLVT